MSKIKLNLPEYVQVFNGLRTSFIAPCNCNEVDGLVVNDVAYTFRDSHCNDLTGLGNLFSAGACVDVMLETEHNYAYIMNAATNGYLEATAIFKDRPWVLTPAQYGKELPEPGIPGRVFFQLLEEADA